MKKFIYLLIFIAGFNPVFAKETQRLVWPPPPDEPRIEYVKAIHNSDDFGIKKGFFSKVADFLFGEEERGLVAPFGVHSDGERVYTTDIASKSLYIFDKKENEMIVVEGSEKEKFLYPIDIAVSAKGDMFVSDSVRAKIYVFNKKGDFVYNISFKELQRPVGLAISADEQKLYIVDALSSQIHITSLKGQYLSSIGKNGRGDGEFNRPTFMDIGNDGKLYVADSMNHRVQMLDKDGKFINKFGKLGQEIGSFGSPRGISVDGHGNIYVSDTMFNNVQIFNQSGELLLVLGHYGDARGEFALPEDISITKDNVIYITDTNNKRVQVLKLLNSNNGGSAK